MKAEASGSGDKGVLFEWLGVFFVGTVKFTELRIPGMVELSVEEIVEPVSGQE